jgi:hypothetical protein
MTSEQEAPRVVSASREIAAEPRPIFVMMTLTQGSIRENHVVEFDEGRRIAWRPAEPGQPPPGHLWRWELEPAGPSRTRVTCTYDWTQLTDEKRLPRALATTPDRLRASLDRLAALAEGSAPALWVPLCYERPGPAGC